MNRIIKTLILCIALGLTACASPATNMTQDEIASLSNNQLCNLKNNYLWDQKTEIEIGRRNLNCDPIYNECLQRGAEPGPEMSMCMSEIREKQAMQQQIAQQQRDLESERRRNEMLARQNQAPAAPYFCPGFPYCQ